MTLLGSLWRGLVWPPTRSLRALRFLGMLLGCALLIYSQWRVHVLDVTVDMEIPTSADATLYFSYNGIAFYPEQSQTMRGPLRGGVSRFRTRIHSRQPIRAVRLDPLDKVGTVQWSAIQFAGVGGTVRVEGEALRRLIRSSLDLQIGASQREGLALVATGGDPQVMMDVPASVIRMPIFERWRYALTLLGSALACAVLLDLLSRALHPQHRFAVWARHRLDALADTLSEDATIRFSRGSLLVLLGLACLASVWVSLKLHQSSLGRWDDMYPREHVHRLVDIGHPKAIRSDEWSTFTPWILNQVQTGMGHDNPNMGAPGVPVLSGSPVQGPLMWAQPKYWGFVWLDIERGFSWLWAFRALGLLASVFLLLLALTRGDTLVSLAGAVGLYGSSYMQWWFSAGPPEFVTGFAMAVVASIYLLQARKAGGIWFGAVVLSLAVPNLLLHLYPPSLLPLAYLAVFLMVAMVFHREGLARVLARWPLRLMAGVCVLGVWAYLVLTWYQAVRETIDVMRDTHYPGQRFALGGDRAWDRMFFGFFESWQTTEDERPFQPSNNPEMSHLWMLFPVVPLLIPVRNWLQHSHRLVLGLMAFCVVAVLWASGPLPDVVRQGMAHAGWFMVPGDRTIFGLGVASLLLVAVVVAGVARGDLVTVTWPTWLLTALVGLVVMAYGLWLQTLDPDFFHLGRLLLGTAGVMAFVWAMHRGQRVLYLLASVVVAAPMLYVNPLQSGIAPYLHKEVFVSAREAGGGPQHRWAVFGSLNLAQGFRMVGLSVLNGTHYTPRLEMIRALDPELQQSEVWNRYAHIELEEAPGTDAPAFKILFLDHYLIRLDVCGPHLRAAGVTHLAYVKPPLPESLRCLQPIATQDNSRVMLYSLTSPVAPERIQALNPD